MKRASNPEKWSTRRFPVEPIPLIPLNPLDESVTEAAATWYNSISVHGPARHKVSSIINKSVFKDRAWAVMDLTQMQRSFMLSVNRKSGAN